MSEPIEWPVPKVPRTNASFDSECSCGNALFEGDEIALVDGEWVCVDCGDEEDDSAEIQAADARRQAAASDPAAD